MSKCLRLEFCINVAFIAVMWKHFKHFRCHRIHLFFFYLLLLSQTLRLFSKMSLFGSHESLRWPITVYLRPSSSVNNFRILTSWKLQGQLLLLFGTLLPLKPHRQARYAKRINFKNNSSILQNMWKKLNAGYDVHANCLLPKMSNLWPLCNGFRS